MSKNKKSFKEIEDNQSYNIKLAEIAKSSSDNAIQRAKQKGFSVAYLEDGNMVKETPSGRKIIVKIGIAPKKRRRVKVGSTFKLS